MFPIPLNTLNDQQRHDFILKTYVLNKNINAKQSSRYKRDIDVIKEHHKFLYHDDEDIDEQQSTWEERLARRYYDKLFKEYCIADLSHYKDNKIALRWRIEAEVVSGKGQFMCGCRKCEECENLRTWEVNFGYLEHGAKKNALVKVRLCPAHSEQLNYRSQKREVKRMKQQLKKSAKQDKHKQKHKNKDKHEEPKQQEEEEKVAQSNEVVEKEQQEELPKHVQDMPMGSNDNVWTKKLVIENEEETREKEFEKYLEDLLF